MQTQAANHDPLASAVNKARLRLAPFLALMFALSMLDRSNVGFVKQALMVDSNIGNAAYALGAGIFFIGYAVFEIPSNLILHRVGAKVWLSRIMVTWGLASAAMMFAHDETSFYVLRFILGVAEAGFSPGVILYSTYWFPASQRGKALGVYYFGLPVALVLGGPVSGLLLDVMGGQLGLRNWQWMFVIEGLAASVVGVIAFFYLVSKPRDAKWLNAEEKTALEAAIAAEDNRKTAHGPATALSALRNWQVLRFVAIYFAIQVSVYGVIFYLPTRISELTGTAIGAKVGLLTAIPWLCALIALRLITGIADARGKQREFAMAMLAMAAIGIALSTLGHELVPVLMAFCLATVGFVVVQPLFWTLPTAYLSGTAAASGIALIGALGNLGGFIAPTLKTAVESAFHSQQAGMLALAIAGVVGVLLLSTVGARARRASTLRLGSSEAA
ncbi:MFS transporter [Cupriavidus neocaledonicus]|uniref:Inner membrane transport protein RhmT n=1 Tax=Cupriavidus neocaledonicus TaxID=1040979 RepID=A0A375HNH6_9BURK|nr:MFS transporter [Cupriavidus neocaledonicus]SOZ40935.1 Inner membrane transport protein RhmT [Cupriavidus neocaledonicus]SPD58985.1 Inner membrane transport protein RhmT [Cupriavidus neocaledonicus]